MGHTQKVSRKPKVKNENQVKLIEETKVEDHVSLFNIVATRRNQPIVLDVEINGLSTPMELDTGAPVSILSEETWKTEFP